MPHCLIIIPAFNEAENIQGVIHSLREVRQEGLDILVINDGSTDSTGEKAREAGAICLDLPYNMGIGNAVHSGYLYAFRKGYSYAVQFDGDGQHPAGSIQSLLQVLTGNAVDVVIGSRFLEKKNGGFQSTVGRRIGIRLISILIRICTGAVISDPTSGFRAVNKRGLEVFANYYPHDYPEPEAIVVALKNGLTLKEIPVSMLARQGGKSSIGALRSVYYMVKISLAIWLQSIGERGQYADN